MKHEIFICDCQNLSHQLILSYDEENLIETNEKYSYPEQLDVSVRLNSFLPFFKRIWVAIKYIFQFGEEKYDYDVVCMPDEEVRRLQECLGFYLSIGRKK